MAEQNLDGPQIAPLHGEARHLVIILHGYGADGADLISLARQWQRQLPDAHFIAPDAPQFCESPPMGYQWFPLTVTMQGVRSSPAERWAGAQSAAPVLHRFIDQQLARFGLDESAMAIAGFSQGAMMALHVGLRRKTAPAAILSYSGALLGPEHLAAEISCRPEVMLAHGDRDEVVPFQAMALTKQALESVNAPVRAYVEEGVGHGIDGEATWHGGEFLTSMLV